MMQLSKLNMPVIRSLEKFITQEQILECLIKYENNRKMEAAKLLQYYMINKWIVTVLEAVNLLKAAYNEINQGAGTASQTNKPNHIIKP